MKYCFAAMWLLMIFTACETKEPKQTYDLAIPDTVHVQWNTGQTPMQGNRISLRFPAGFTLRTDKNSLISGDSCLMLVMESLQQPFTVTENDYYAGVLAYQQKNPGKDFIRYQKKFVLGQDSASLMFRKNIKSGKAELSIIWGGTTSAMMTCHFPDNNPALRQHILESMLTAYIDTTQQPDYIGQQPFTIDTAASVFKFYTIHEGLAYYTPYGKDEADQNFVCATTLPAMPNLQELKSCAKAILGKYTRADFQVTNVRERIFKLNGIDAIEMEFVIKAVNQPKSKIYFIVVGSEVGTIYMVGTFDTKENRLLEDCKKLAHSISIK